jgi:uncharacterized protein (TIGR04168 family)
MKQPSDAAVEQLSSGSGDRPEASEPLKIAVIGDVHDAWDADDEMALRYLGVDLVLLVGDFGNEAVEIVRSVAGLSLPKAVVLGNHDAWYSASEWGMKKCPYDRSKEDRVQQQLDLLGTAHVGYGFLDFPEFGLSVVGARPFSWGGSDWKNTEFYRSRFGVDDFDSSTARIVQAAQQTRFETVLFLGHCGPIGLGDRPEDPCGKDWHPPGGDHGDPDFAAAIAQTRTLGKVIPLVAFGHMHHQLRHTKQHLRTAVVAHPDGTVYVNAANVPRIVPHERNANRDRFRSQRRNFTLVMLQAGIVSQVSLIWMDQDFAVVSEQVMYRSAAQVSALSH